MKRNILIASSALTIVLAAFSTEVFSQPGRFENRNTPQQNRQGGYQRQWQPASPFIIIDADGRRNGYQGRSFDQCFEQRSLSRKQQRKLEKRYGFVPPLVMYVPERYVNRTPRGEFYMYTNGIMYQKQRDGYFHLDDRYFNGDRDKWDYRNDRNDNRGNWNNGPARF